MDWTLGENKPNFIVLRSECCGQRVDSRLRGNDKQQISAFICVNLRLMNLKKQSQFKAKFKQNEGFCLWHKRLPRPFGPRNDIRISDPLCLSAFVAIAQFEKTNPNYSY